MDDLIPAADGRQASTMTARSLLRLAIVGPRGVGKTALAEALHRAGPAGDGDSRILAFVTPARHVVVRDGGPRLFVAHQEGDLVRADAALLLLDPDDGVEEFHVRALALLRHLGLTAVVAVAVRADTLADPAPALAALSRAVDLAAAAAGLTVPLAAVSATTLAGIAAPGPGWGRPSLFSLIDCLPAPPARAAAALRVPLDVTEEAGEGSRWVGFVDAGTLRVGADVMLSPSNQTARVAAIAAGSATVDEAAPGTAATITLDRALRLAPGEVLSHVADAPVETDVFRCAPLWLAEAAPAAPIALALGGAAHAVRLEGADLLRAGDRPEMIVRLPRLLPLDAAATDPRTGRAIFGRGEELLGGGPIVMEGYPDQRGLSTVRATNVVAVQHRISHGARQSRNRHKGGVLWFTGLSGAGKSTLALETERRLFEQGYLVYVLDGDNVRHGLCADLGFSPEDRAENIRRVGAVAALFADAGLIVLSAFISPYRSDRARARAAAPAAFHEVYIKASVEVCEQRDPKGLYARARRGEVPNFTGISAPYEAPETAELVVDTARQDVEASVEQVLDYVRAHFLLAD